MYKFAKKVKIFSLSPLKKYDVYIDIETGNVIDTVSLIAHTDVQGVAKTYYNGTKARGLGRGRLPDRCDHHHQRCSGCLRAPGRCALGAAVVLLGPGGHHTASGRGQEADGDNLARPNPGPLAAE